ncbi:hypothetical protein C8034_v000014 [Colletotrichum sidae]|uniref:2EXR domain-containing protein n=1 Tax=Colletotrichum sidae TaxID=1347389 RepID=A0A4R8SM36_9PEZI|nr:hypothetical protein C8034_v000014 [Colletotrichum sidae]
MATFHCFPLLPLEVRQCIWELAMDHRQILYGEEPVSGYKCPWPSSAPPPPLLHACAESRTYLQRYYRKVYATGKDTGRYDWVDFDIDTLYLPQDDLETLHAQYPMARRLIILGIDSHLFRHYHSRLLLEMEHMEDVTILHMQSPDEVDNEWWQCWDAMMDHFYLHDDPVHFYLRILYPEAPPYEMNPESCL